MYFSELAKHEANAFQWQSPQNVAAPNTPTKIGGDQPYYRDVPARAAAPKPNYSGADAPC